MLVWNSRNKRLQGKSVTGMMLAECSTAAHLSSLHRWSQEVTDHGDPSCPVSEPSFGRHLFGPRENVGNLGRARTEREGVRMSLLWGRAAAVPEWKQKCASGTLTSGQLCSILQIEQIMRITQSVDLLQKKKPYLEAYFTLFSYSTPSKLIETSSQVEVKKTDNITHACG